MQQSRKKTNKMQKTGGQSDPPPPSRYRASKVEAHTQLYRKPELQTAPSLNCPPTSATLPEEPSRSCGPKPGRRVPRAEIQESDAATSDQDPRSWNTEVYILQVSKKKMQASIFQERGPNQKSPHQIPRTRPRNTPAKSQTTAPSQLSRKWRRSWKNSPDIRRFNACKPQPPMKDTPRRGIQTNLPSSASRSSPPDSTAHLQTRTGHFPPLDPPPVFNSLKH